MAKRDASDPNRLVREVAGRYRTPDGRFTVESGESGTWYVADAERQNELGMPLLLGPFPTLAAVRDAVRAAREEPPSGAPAPPSGRTSQRRQAKAQRADAGGRPADRHRKRDEAPPRKPKPRREPTWLESLPPDRRAEAARLIGALSALAAEDAERLVRRELERNEPAIATSLLAERLETEAIGPWRSSPAWISAALAGRGPLRGQAATLRALLDAGVDRAAIAALAGAVAGRAVELAMGTIESEGFDPSAGRPLRGWRLVETDESGQPTGRRVSARS